jgi:hypothetical protein
MTTTETRPIARPGDDRTSLPAVREIILLAAYAGWAVRRLAGGMGSRFVRGDEVVSVDWSRSGTIRYADRRRRDDENGSALFEVDGLWASTGDVLDDLTRGKRETVIGWLVGTDGDGEDSRSAIGGVQSVWLDRLARGPHLSPVDAADRRRLVGLSVRGLVREVTPNAWHITAAGRRACLLAPVRATARRSR